MKIVRYIIDDRGIVLIVDQMLSRDGADALQADFDEWAQMANGRHFPVLVLLGDENTQVTDLRAITGG